MIDAAAPLSVNANAYLINVARGSLVEQPALAEALRKHVIAGGAIDVRQEPPGAAGPLLQVVEDKVPFSPRVAGISAASGRRIMMESAENIGRTLEGQEPLYVVNA